MNRFWKTTVLSLALGATALTAVPATARDWHHRSYNHHHRGGGGNALAAGALGLAAGAVIGGALAQPAPVYRPRYYEPAPRVIYREPAPVYYRGAYEPWTQEWYRACNARYRTFDPGSGTYMGYDGVRHFCELNY